MKGMLPSVEQAFVGRDETRAPLKTPAWEASKCATLCKNGLGTFLTRCFNVHEWTEILFPHVYDYEYNVGTYLSIVRMRAPVNVRKSGQKLHSQMYAFPVATISLRLVTSSLLLSPWYV